MPVREIKKSYRGLPSLFSSRKALNTQVFCESVLERDFYHLLEFFDYVIFYEEQPFKIPYLDTDENPGKYTPDTLVHLAIDNDIEKCVYEVKYRSDLWENWAEYRQKFRWAVHYCREQGFRRFKIMTEVEIRQGSKLKNIKKFLKNRYSSVDPVLISYITGLLAECATLETRPLLQNLWEQGVEENDSLVALYHLIANHVVALDIEAPFTYHSELWLRPEGLSRYNNSPPEPLTVSA